MLLFTASPSLPAADSTSPGSARASANHYASVGSRLVSTILTSHMRCIYSCLQTTQPMRLVASCLKLLTAMVLQGPATAKDIQQSFNFGYKPLEVLPNRTHLLQVRFPLCICTCMCVPVCIVHVCRCVQLMSIVLKLKFFLVMAGVD